MPMLTLDDTIKLNGLISDINPTEICSQIESDNLSNWCKTIQAEIRMALSHVPLAQPEQGWTPITGTEMLPKKNVRVLTTFMCANGETSVDIKHINQQNGQWENDYDFDVSYYDNVIAWMPLPRPYKEGENGCLNQQKSGN